MSLTKRFSGEFDRAIRERGENYFRRGRASITSTSEDRIQASVRGSSRYNVELKRDGQRLLASCSCRYFDTDLCKHIWAVLLLSERQRLLPDDNLKLVHRGDPHDDYGGGDEDDSSPYAVAGSAASPAPSSPPEKTEASGWRERIARLNRKPTAPYSFSVEPWPPTRSLFYLIETAARPSTALHLEILCRDLKKDGEWSKPRPRYLHHAYLDQIPDADDRHILATLAGASPLYGDAFPGYESMAYRPSLSNRYVLTVEQARLLLPLMCRTGRCHRRASVSDGQMGSPLAWREGEPWQFRLGVRRLQKSEHYELTGLLQRGDERMEVSAAVVLHGSGILLAQEWAATYEPSSASNWIELLSQHAPLRVPVAQSEAFLAELFRQPNLPPLDLPDELRCDEVAAVPRPRLTVKASTHGFRGESLHGDLSFDYDGSVVTHDDPSRGVLQQGQRRLLLRDLDAEKAAQHRLHLLGWRWETPNYMERKQCLELAARHLPRVVRELTAEGWHVEAQGKTYRTAGRFDISVSSGVDWFELHGTAKFGDAQVQLPELLAALRRGEHIVKLGDGGFGVLPEDWLKQYGLLAGLGETHGDHLRFKRSQAGVLDVLLAAQPEAQCDALFTRVRDELRSFAGIEALDAPAGFTGDLRPYQKEALGWFAFLRRFGFGGCLADDMGLGKTVQVLALLEERRALRERGNRKPRRASPGAKRSTHVAPSLAVVPRSLIFNWQQEAARFAPRLRVLDHTGALRLKGKEHFEDYDLVLTTYGTLRNDAMDFKDVKFDYVILDESQAIKNADSVSAKAVRLLQAEHRLALSGTPIENHLGELWSLFQFLNPGMLGAASVFKMSDGIARNPDEQTRKLLAQAVRPFILRRTKEQVARELPPKVEQTIYCDLGTRQRKLYDQLRDHYRATLMRRAQTDGIGRSKIQILEALLRLRQAAIHPGLLDEGRLAESSAKLDVLLSRVLEVIDEGHKVLVFSQFTGMLSILRQHLDREGVVYEYLDGRTRDRQRCVERFQNDPLCKLFLISLKAGGVGLNLTAAQYVFLLDPWWNPAVEAQAIDRTHRIGQTDQVFAYRLIARGTVEEKVLELQNTKRDLADAIVGANEGLIRNLNKDDLELLLS